MALFTAPFPPRFLVARCRRKSLLSRRCDRGVRTRLQPVDNEALEGRDGTLLRQTERLQVHRPHAEG